MKNRIFNLDILIEILIYFRLSVTIMPIVDFYSNSIINIGSFLLLYFCIILKNGLERTFWGFIRILPLFLISVFYLVVDIIQGKSIIDGLYQLFILIQWPIVCFYLVRKQNWSMIKRILIFTFFCYVITSVTTYIGSILFEGAARHMSNGNFAQDNPELMDLYYSFNIGSFSFIYSLVIIFPFLIFLIRNSQKRGVIWAIISCVSVFAAIIKTEYTTAILLTLSCFLLFLLPKSFKKINLYTLIFVASVLVIYFVPVLSGLMSAISDIVGSEQVTERLSSIANFRTSSATDESSDLGQRIVLWNRSWDIFASNIFFGSSEQNGGHSFILDNMARFGLLGFIAMIIVFTNMYKTSIKYYEGYTVYGYALFAFFLNIVQCVVNPVINYFCFTFFAPLFCLYFSQENHLRSSPKLKE